MWTTVILIGVEILVILLFLPIKVGVKGYFSLSTMNAALDLKVFVFTAVRLRIFKFDGKIQVKINDKPANVSKFKPNINTTKKIVKYFAGGNLRVGGNMLAVVGAGDSKNCAIIQWVASAVTKTIKNLALQAKTRIFADFGSERADADFAFVLKINLVQAFEMLSR